MRPRRLVGLILITLPVWFIPALVWVGWKEAGWDVIFHQVPIGLRYVLTGQDRWTRTVTTKTVT